MYNETKKGKYLWNQLYTPRRPIHMFGMCIKSFQQENTDCKKKWIILFNQSKPKGKGLSLLTYLHGFPSGWKRLNIWIISRGHWILVEWPHGNWIMHVNSLYSLEFHQSKQNRNAFMTERLRAPAALSLFGWHRVFQHGWLFISFHAEVVFALFLC